LSQAVEQMFEYFISPKEQQKLTLFQYILFAETDLSKNQLARELHYKPSTLHRYIQELKDDLADNFNGKVTLHENKNKQIRVLFDTTLTIDYLIASLRLFYTNGNPLQEIIMTLIKKKYSSVTELAYDLHFGESTVYKAIAELKEILAAFRAKLDFEANNNFVGDELGICYFIFLVYWNISLTLQDPPFSKAFPKEFIDLHFIKKQLGINKELSKSQTVRIKLISGIISHRTVFLGRTIKLEQPFLDDIQFFYNGKPALNLHQYNVPADVIKKESILFSFLTRELIYGIDSFPQKKQIVSLYQSSNLEIAKEITAMLELFRQTFSLNYEEKNYIESYYLLLLNYIYIKHFFFDVDIYTSVSLKKNSRSIHKNNRYKNIYSTLNDLIEQSTLSNRLTGMATLFLTKIIKCKNQMLVI
jgi:hypothetical protein